MRRHRQQNRSGRCSPLHGQETTDDNSDVNGMKEEVKWTHNLRLAHPCKIMSSRESRLRCWSIRKMMMLMTIWWLRIKRMIRVSLVCRGSVAPTISPSIRLVVCDFVLFAAVREKKDPCALNFRLEKRQQSCSLIASAYTRTTHTHTRHECGIALDFYLMNLFFVLYVFYSFRLFDMLGAVHFDCGCVENDSVGNSRTFAENKSLVKSSVVASEFYFNFCRCILGVKYINFAALRGNWYDLWQVLFGAHVDNNRKINKIKSIVSPTGFPVFLTIFEKSGIFMESETEWSHRIFPSAVDAVFAEWLGNRDHFLS